MKHRLIELMAEKQKKEHRLITPEVVAAEARIHPNTIKNWMEGKLKRVDSGVAVKLCKYFGKKSLADLVYIDWKDEKETA